MLKKIVIVALFFVFIPIGVEAAFTTNLYYGKEEKPKSCPGTFRHNVQLVSEGAYTAVVSPFSPGAVVSSSMIYAQRRVNEAEHCELDEKQAEKISSNYEKQYQRVEKKIEKVKNKEEVTERVANQVLYQNKKLEEISQKNKNKEKVVKRMNDASSSSTERMVQKNIGPRSNDFKNKLKEVRENAISGFRKIVPEPTKKTPTKTEAQIRKEEDCLPGETLEQCMEEDWDGKYFSAEEYERANGLR